MRNKRKKHFVDRAVQGAILLHFVVYWAALLVAISAFIYSVEVLTSVSRDPATSFLAQHGLALLAVLLVTPMYLYELCKLTNRFTGPIVRLRRAMHELAEGREVTHIQFRDGDFWQELAVDFNRVVERFQPAETDVADDELQPAHMTSGSGDYVNA